MKARKFQLMAALAALLTTMTLHGQVTIGSLDAPKTGAILDLNSATTGGLLFSNVALVDRTHIPGGNLFAGITTETASNTNLTGMVVYNTTTNPGQNLSPGLYVWVGTSWVSLSDAAEIAQLRTDINGLIGTPLSGLTTAQKGSIVEGINSVNAKIGDLSLLAAGAQTTVLDGINAVNTKVGTGVLATQASAIIPAINEVLGIANNLSSAKEVEGSPYLSYDAFTSSPADTMQFTPTPYFAYVTFTSAVDDIGEVNNLAGSKNDARWSSINDGETWRLDYSPSANGISGGAWHLTSNMTEVIKASLIDDDPSMSLVAIPSQESRNTTVAIWLQDFRNNLKALLGKYDGYGLLNVTAGGTGATNPENARSNLGAQEAIATSSTSNLLTAPETLGGQPGTIAPAALTAGKATVLATARSIGDVSFDGSASIDLPGVNLPGNQNTTGSAATLTTPRNIALTGVVTGNANFDGSAPISIATSTPNEVTKLVYLSGASRSVAINFTDGSMFFGTIGIFRHPIKAASNIFGGRFSSTDIPGSGVGIGNGNDATYYADAINNTNNVSVVAGNVKITLNPVSKQLIIEPNQSDTYFGLIMINCKSNMPVW